jgi:hypothetical protein
MSPRGIGIENAYALQLCRHMIGTPRVDDTRGRFYCLLFYITRVVEWGR